MNEFPQSTEQLTRMDRNDVAEAILKAGHYTRLILALLPEWRPFFHEHFADVADMERKLGEGLDDLSHKSIHRFLCFYKILLAAEESTGKRLSRYDMLLHKDFFLFDEEIELKKELETSTQNIANGLIFPEDKKSLLDFSQIGLGFGLKFVPDHHRRLKGRDVIDGGAFNGDSALTFCGYSPKSVHSFEPSPESFDLLKLVVDLNRRKNDIIPVQKALGKESGIFPFYTGAGEDDAAGFRFQEGKATLDVDCITVDQYVQEGSLDPALIKLDIEGGEFDAISGATETIRQYCPILLISAYHRPKDFFEIKPFLESLNVGYEIIYRQASFRWLNADLFLIAYRKSTAG